jgi:hypothetical protein
MLTADQASSETLADAHLIIMGTQARQPLVGEFLADQEPISDLILNGFRRITSGGIVQEIVSPWNSERTALLVYATSYTGLDNAVSALFNAAPPVIQPGSVAIVEPDASPVVIPWPAEAPTETVAEEEQPQPSPVEALPGEESAEQPFPWSTATITMTVILALITLAVLGALLFARRRGANESDAAPPDDIGEHEG